MGILRFQALVFGCRAVRNPKNSGFPWTLEVEDLDPEEAAGGRSGKMKRSLKGINISSYTLMILYSMYKTFIYIYIIYIEYM